MTLFPHRAPIGSTDYGLDADHDDHSSDDVPSPELEVTEPKAVGVLWAPDGDAYRLVYDRATVPFGFQPRSKR